MIKHGTDSTFNDLIKEKQVIVDFFATWCGPCKMLSPVIDELSNKYPDITFVKIDVDECPTISREYGVMSVPTLLKFEDGNLVDKKIGYLNINNFEKWIS